MPIISIACADRQRGNVVFGCLRMLFCYNSFMDRADLDIKRREYRELLRRSVDTVVSRLSGPAVERISLFGSYARGRADLFTDLDILVIMQTDRPFIERAGEIHSMLRLPVDADVICYTPEEFGRMRDSAFVRKILEDEVVLYEKKSG